MNESATNQPKPVASESSVAVLQGFLLFATWTLSVSVVVTWWGASPAWAVWWGMVVVMGYSALLGLEFMLASLHHGADPVPRADWPSVMRAWWHETWAAAAVFGWRQPFDWRKWPDTVTMAESGGRAVPSVELPAIVFIHGFVCNRGFWHPWMRVLRARGQAYVSMNLEPVMASIDEWVGQVEAAVGQVEAAQAEGGGAKPVFICHSMGGLVARAWMAAAPHNSGRVHRVITIGTPHHGTWLARWSHTACGRQMRIGSEWLASLERREAAWKDKRAPITCWYSNTDNIVFPPTTATLVGADNRLIQRAGHVSLAFHPTVMRESLSMLASGASSAMLRTSA